MVDANTKSGADHASQGQARLLLGRLEAARVLGVSPGTIDNLRRGSDLPSVKIGTRRLFDMADLRRFIERRKGVCP